MIYIVTEREFEYNDEYYYQPLKDGRPVIAYKTKESAERAAREKNLEWLNGQDLSRYGYSASFIFHNPDEVASLCGKDKDVDDWFNINTSSLDCETMAKILDQVSILPFKVVGIDLE